MKKPTTCFMDLTEQKSAIIELCILYQDLESLKIRKIEEEIKYLKIAIEKTAGKNELEAWSWLIKHIENYKKNLK